MKARILSVFMVLLISAGFVARADEGMWLPNKIKQLNYTDMQKLGCKLSAEDIYDINHASMKDAIFQLLGEGGQGFCTGEIVSAQGLMLTNHHCGYESITKLSTVEHDYLTDGFWAMSKDKELSVTGLSVSRVVRIEDVTATVLAEVTEGMKESERNAKIEKAIEKIEKEAIDGNHYNANVKEFFKGGEFYLFVYEVFGDVRLVGAPPSSIGKFGGDTDNWMWPRHTGDFSMFRVYMAPDGKPTEGYSADNVPYKPLHFLPVSIKGVKQGDFTMIMGYPGETDRYLSSYGMEYKRDVFNPVIVKLLDTKLKIWKEDMAASDNVRLALADSYASLANGWKLFDGEAQTLRSTNAIEEKQKLEKEFAAWVNQDDKRKEKYGKILADIESGYKEMGASSVDLFYASLGLLQASDQIMATTKLFQLKSLLDDPKGNKESIDKAIAELKPEMEKQFEKFFPETDKKVLLAQLNLYYKDIPAESRSGVFANYIFKTFKDKTPEASIVKFVNTAFTTSIFTAKERMMAFLNKPSKKVLENDPFMKYFMEIALEAQMKGGKYQSLNNKLGVSERIFVEGLREMQVNNTFYPDANSTLRLTYGSVQPYKPRDAVQYDYRTYIDGIIEKMDNTNDEFKVSPRLVELYEKKDYGQYADETGKLPVGFLSDNDITGGNSGSPIINGNGELIGLAFDGNWEWLCSNLLFSKELQRTINVDIRYVLWVIDKFAGAKHLVDEMTVVK
ncbi:MAG: hypothetical protein A2W91_20050 [Bacteroidetes bacterium GWF2_38_335]|nr:MAG: hypothetical protein A2W91_20050 [Bacteroidetes bacterium GWF2_38_335]OFY81988.1 MAG: hypothetical protein A2281_09870 [Bacteroidetes bacterium RIFOXYA12_FULL_38_20]HBS86513.1 serine protease [Bacteroidales bacterium]